MHILLQLFLIFFKIGITTFGGGYAMISQVKENIVHKKKWLEEDELLEIIAIAETTPGPIAINMATYVGYKKGKILGSVLATLGVVLPSLLVIFIISLFLDKVITNTYVSYAFVGIKCAVAFLIIKAGVEMLIKAKKNFWRLSITFIVIALLILFELLSISFSSIYLILIGALLGIIFSSLIDAKKVDEK